MHHALTYPEHGMVMEPDGHWDGTQNFEFKVDGISDSGEVTEAEWHKRRE